MPVVTTVGFFNPQYTLTT